MAEYDELYLVKNPFFLGSFEKAIAECENIVLEDSDTENLEKKTFYLIRAHLALADHDKAEAALKKHLAAVKCKADEKENFENLMRHFIEFVKTGVSLDLSIEIRPRLYERRV